MHRSGEVLDCKMQLKRKCAQFGVNSCLPFTRTIKWVQAASTGLRSTCAEKLCNLLAIRFMQNVRKFSGLPCIHQNL